MWWLSGPHWASPAHQWITVHDSTALSHFLCLDMNRKERIPTVVNTGAAMPHPPLSPPIHILFHTTSVRSSIVFTFSNYNGITTKCSKMLNHQTQHVQSQETCTSSLLLLLPIYYIFSYICQNMFYLQLFAVEKCKMINFSGSTCCSFSSFVWSRNRWGTFVRSWFYCHCIINTILLLQT